MRSTFSILAEDLRRVRASIALYLIEMFASDPEKFILQKAQAAIELMKEHKLFNSEAEYVHQILEVFSPHGLSLQELTNLLGKHPWEFNEFSVVTREEWEAIFPHIAVNLKNSILLKINNNKTQINE